MVETNAKGSLVDLLARLNALLVVWEDEASEASAPTVWEAAADLREVIQDFWEDGPYPSE